MIEAFRSGGVMMWPMLAVALGVAWLAVRTALRLRAARPGTEEEAHRSLQAILFWGAIAVVLGALGTVVGWVVAAQAIARAGTASPSLVWSGFGVTLITLIFGLLIFLLSALLWFGLRHWHVSVARRLEAH